MSLSIELLHYDFLYEQGIEVCTKTKKVQIEDLDRNFMSCIEGFLDKDFVTSVYNPSTNEYETLLYEDRFTYMLIEGRYEWHVSSSDVTVRDIINTFDIEENGTIVIKEACLFGKGDPVTYINAIVAWIPYIIRALDNIGRVLTAKAIFQKVKPYYHKLIGKDNKVASPYEFLKMLNSKDTWTMRELRKRTSLDEIMIECMLIQGGFAKLEKENIYKRTNIDNEEYMYQKQIEIEESLWGELGDAEDDITEIEELIEDDFGCEEKEYDEEDYDEDGEYTFNDCISDLMYAIHNINRCLTSLKIQSDINKSEFFDFMMKIINFHIRKWSSYLYKGGKLQFIKLKVGIRTISEYDLDKLLYSTNCLCEYVSHLCEVLDNN